MMVEMHRRKKQLEFIVKQAIAAVVEGTPNAIDMDFTGIGVSPSDLDLPLPDEPDNQRIATLLANRYPC
jgi:hypothetical protein